MLLRQQLRSLSRAPGFSGKVVLVLALGIGTSIAVFSVINTAILRPLPWPSPDRIVQLMVETPLGATSLVALSQFDNWREYVRGFDALAAYEPRASLEITALRVSAGYFAVFGGSPSIGRVFSPDEDLPGGTKVAVISDRLWRDRYDASRDVTAKTIQFEESDYQIIGVLRPQFVSYPQADVWIPLQAPRFSFDHTPQLRVVGRLNAVTTVAMAQREMWFAAGQFSKTFPGVMGPRDHFTIRSIRDVIVGDIRPALFLVSGAVVLLLLMACANAGSLLLVRGAKRTVDVATRVALGAGRQRVLAESLMETGLLSLAAAVSGLLLGSYGIRWLLALYPGSLPMIPGIRAAPDGHVVAFAILTGFVTSFLAGAAPAWMASRVDLASCFHQQNTSSMRRDSVRMRSLVVAAQVTAAVILIIGSGSLINTFLSLHSDMSNLEPATILTLRMAVTDKRYENTATVDQLLRNAERTVANVPGVIAIATTSSLPLEPVLFALPFTILGREQVTSPYHGKANWQSVSPDYFRVFRIRQEAGRPFSNSDNGSAAPVAIINRAMAKKYWAGASPTGQKISLGAALRSEFNEPAREIVGVVDDVRDVGLRREVEPAVYVPIAQVHDKLNAVILTTTPLSWAIRVRSRDTSRTRIREAIPSASGAVAFGRLQSMEEVLFDLTARAKFNTILITVFAGLALVIAASGIYGVASYSVEQRNRELGIRVAVGAKPGQIRSLLLRDSARIVLPAACVGLFCAEVLMRYMDRVIFGTAAMPIGAITIVMSIFCAIFIAAAYVAGRQATRMDTLTTLRSN
jgi:putative ABC transport system permease protein